MKTTTVSKLKNTLSAQLKRVYAGESLLVTDRNKPVAILQPLESKHGEQRVEKLIAAGIVAPGRTGIDLERFFSSPRGACRGGLSRLIEEERDER